MIVIITLNDSSLSTDEKNHSLTRFSLPTFICALYSLGLCPTTSCTVAGKLINFNNCDNL